MGMISDAPEQYLSNLVSRSISEITFRSKSVSECSRYQIHVYGIEKYILWYKHNTTYTLSKIKGQ